MRKRRVWLSLLGFVALVGLSSASLYEYTTHVGRGWLRGEAFYEGRPTSYWRHAIKHDLEAQFQFDGPTFNDRHEMAIIKNPVRTWDSSWSDRCKVWLGFPQEEPRSIALLKEESPSAVMLELQRDADPTIAEFARDAYLAGLGFGGSERRTFFYCGIGMGMGGINPRNPDELAIYRFEELCKKTILRGQ
jgi:hypothetical protein